MPDEREVRRILKRLRKEGLPERRGKGDHVLFFKDGNVISVPTSRKEVSIGVYNDIKKKAGW